METKPKTYPSEAQRILRRRLAKRGAAADLARRLGADPGLVSRWVAAKRKPAAEYRDLIQDTLGIDSRLWSKPPRKGAA